MKYILITSKGRVMTFYVQGLADTYQRFLGGVVVAEAAVDVCGAGATVDSTT